MMKDPIAQAIREQKQRTLTPMRKTRLKPLLRLKPLTREPKKSVLEPEQYLTPKTPTHN